MRFVSLFFGIFVFLFSASLLAQSDRESLEMRRQEALEELARTSRLLDDNEKTQKQSLNQLNVLSAQVKARQALISSLKEELRILDQEIRQHETEVANFRRKIENIRKEYAANILHAYKNRQGDNLLAFLFTSKDFTQAYRRKKYFETFSTYRKSQSDTARSLQKKMEGEIVKLNEGRKEKLKVQQKELEEAEKLRSQVTLYNQSLRQLRNNATRLRRELNQKKSAADKLAAEIKSLIEREAKKLGGSSTDIYSKLSTVDQALSRNFKENRGKLPWPVDEGFVSATFGLHPHPVLRGVMLPHNNGMDISTTSGSEVKSVFDGEISRVVAIPGANYAIIVRHGNFLTVYQNMVNIAVKQGDKVKTGGILGKVFAEPGEKSSVLHFEIWEESNKHNPEPWLKRRM